MKTSKAESAALAAASYAKPLTRSDVTEMIVAAKILKGIKWTDPWVEHRRTEEKMRWVRTCAGRR